MKPVDPRFQQIRDHIEVYQEIALQDYNVPAPQAFPVASKPDIAFRPSCAQIEPVWEPGRTAWVWQGQTLYKTPGEATVTDESLSWLQSAGICLTGPQVTNVPLVPTEEVLTKLEQATSATIAKFPEKPHSAFQQTVEQWIADTAAVPHSILYGGVFVLAPLPLIGIGIGLMILNRNTPEKK